MEKLKFTIIPDWRELRNILIYTLSVIAIVFIVSNIVSCSDDTFIAGYNKDMEEINQQIFEVDSLLRTIYMDLDSLNFKIQ